jgi:hypothetical protein
VLLEGQRVGVLQPAGQHVDHLVHRPYVHVARVLILRRSAGAGGGRGLNRAFGCGPGQRGGQAAGMCQGAWGGKPSLLPPPPPGSLATSMQLADSSAAALSAAGKARKSPAAQPCGALLASGSSCLLSWSASAAPTWPFGLHPPTPPPTHSAPAPPPTHTS